MGIRNLKPVTPGSRFASRSDFADLTTQKPEKKLTVALRKKAGRNNTGRDQDFSNKMVIASEEKADDLANRDAALREGETAVLSILA